MNEITGRFRISILPSFFDESEMEVAEFLLLLPNHIIQAEDQRGKFPWGSKKMRGYRIPKPSSWTDTQKTCQAETEIEKKTKVNGEAASPSSPLAFFPSETDEKPKHSLKKNSNKRQREESLGIIDELNQQRELLKREVERLRSEHKRLKKSNLQLKGKMQELICLPKENPHSKINKSMNLGMGKKKSSVKVEYQDQNSMVSHHRPSIMDQTTDASQNREKSQYPYGQSPPLLSSGSGSAKVDRRNVSEEKTLEWNSRPPLDPNRAVADYRAGAAEARKRRKIKMETKRYSIARTRTKRAK